MARRYQVLVRKTNGLEIWFVSPRDIYVKDKYGWNNFTRWDVRQRGFCTKHWNPFRKALKYQRYLDMSAIRRLATLHEISIRAGSPPDWAKTGKIVELPEKGRNRNNEGFRSQQRY